jgi:hypothetical protein
MVFVQLLNAITETAVSKPSEASKIFSTLSEINKRVIVWLIQFLKVQPQIKFFLISEGIEHT